MDSYPDIQTETISPKHNAVKIMGVRPG